jgi:hypothetical protein
MIDLENNFTQDHEYYIHSSFVILNFGYFFIKMIFKH